MSAEAPTPPSAGSLPPVSLPPGSVPPASLPPDSLPPEPDAPRSDPPHSNPSGQTSLGQSMSTLAVRGQAEQAARRRPSLLAPAALCLAVVLGIAGGLGWRAASNAANGPEEVARRFLAALAQGDAAAALAESTGAPVGTADTSLLTDAALAAANSAYPRSGVLVSRLDDSHVRYSYSAGSVPVSDVLTIARGAGGYKVATPTVRVSFAGVRNPAAPPQLAGRDASTPLLVFPGVYPLRTAFPRLVYGPGYLTATVRQPELDTAALTLAPTPDGIAAFRAAAVAGLTACLRQTALAPTGCPFSYQPVAGENIDQASIRWSVQGAPLTDVVPDVADPTSARAEVAATFTLTATVSGKPVSHSIKAQLRPRADLTAQTVAVTWG